MEIKIHSQNTSKKIEVNKSIISIQEDDNSILNNIIKDYNPAVIDNNNLFFLGKTVLDEISTYNKYPELNIIYDVIKILDLSNEFLDKKISELSTTEKIYLNLLRNISKIEEMIVFKNIFLGLDLHNQKLFTKILTYLKDKYIVFISSDDVNTLYKLCDLSIISSKKTIKYDDTDKIYTNVKDLIKMNLDIPDLSYITYKAKEEKNVKLYYRKDVRDTIKDIYKHV